MRYLSSKYGSPDDVNVQLDIDRTDLERIEGHCGAVVMCTKIGIDCD